MSSETNRDSPSFPALVILDWDKVFVIRGSIALAAMQRAETMQVGTVETAAVITPDEIDITIQGGEFERP